MVSYFVLLLNATLLISATEAMTEAAVRHEFAKMEEEHLAKGGSPQTPPVAFIGAAIEIEDTQ